MNLDLELHVPNGKDLVLLAGGTGAAGFTRRKFDEDEFWKI